MRTLYVGGLGAETSPDELRRMFGSFGGVADARIATDDATGACRGFGYVTFLSDAAAERAIHALDGRLRDGRKLRVDVAG